ncbi:hypothetical protein [Amycolatopsis sp. DG1A-15b]|uniref:hypothetical protein n=1 Tax=Amycolatopsis sp. DG1A-15b TaxID=3052846 RepID=UPI00255BBDA1|nr:hypothetical protein [Amycolatopsis sp. DG1A-15b]WIX93208.1 hypothetical protein QRY02_23295 [Amycolatopsis sp. DG1A-15b]
MTTDDKDLLIRALGTDEPPLQLDLDAIEARGHARRRTRGLIAVTAAVLGVGAIAGGVVRGAGAPSALEAAAPGSLVPPTERDIAYCYQTADIGSAEPNQHVAIGVGGRDGRVDVTGQIMQICSGSWQSNVYDFQPRQAAGTSYRIPQLVACVLTGKATNATEGAVGVFPGNGSTCAALGLPTAQI